MNWIRLLESWALERWVDREEEAEVGVGVGGVDGVCLGVDVVSLLVGLTVPRLVNTVSELSVFEFVGFSPFVVVELAGDSSDGLLLFSLGLLF